MKPFDLHACPLAGTHLIASGAGTGKTYAISHLFIRLLIEKELPLKSILVVTYTEAATEELRHRIRTLIAGAIDSLGDKLREESDLGRIVASAADHKEPKRVRVLLTAALHGLDEAAIHTIHGFCHKVLKENTFETGVRFNTDLVTDLKSLVEEAVRDFWRKEFYQAPPQLIARARSHNWSPAMLTSLVHDHLGQPDLHIIPDTAPPDTSNAEARYAGVARATADEWRASRDRIVEILNTDPGLSRTSYGKRTLPGMFDGMDQFVAHNAADPGLFKGFGKFTHSVIEESLRKNAAPPRHHFFDLCEELDGAAEALRTALDQTLVALKRRCFLFVQERLADTKKRRNILTFNDMLTDVHRALHGPRKQGLLNALRARYQAVLIDEFQDTDPVQYDIFSSLFQGEETPLFFIGDPKQAIYSFRGADVFAYLRAAESVPDANCHTMTVNRRSGQRLINAVNTLFGARKQPFLLDGIPFQPAEAPTPANAPELTLQGKRAAPCVIRFVPYTDPSGKGKPMSRQRAEETCCRLVADRVASLVELGSKGKALLGDRAVLPSDIAVLVRQHRQARQLKRMFGALGVKAVLQSAGSVFESHEAVEMAHLLSAIASPGSEGLLKSALCTSLLDVGPQALDRSGSYYPPGNMSTGETFDELCEHFDHYHDLWRRHGFTRMFVALLSSHGSRARLLSFPDGERRLTNVLHLAEILGRQSAEESLNMHQLVKWFAAQLSPGGQGLDEHEIRLESDGNAVRIMTVFKSKGQQFPIVFCPFTWAGRSCGDTDFVFHGGSDGMTRILDLGGPDQAGHRVLANREILAEELRLLYVALTRAQSRCYLYLGRFSGAENSAPAYLLHHASSQQEPPSPNTVLQPVGGPTDNDMLNGLETLADGSAGTVEVVTSTAQGVPASPAAPSSSADQLTCRTLDRPVTSRARLASYTSLVSQRPEDAELPDREGIGAAWFTTPVMPPSDNGPPTMFTLPRGVGTGNFLHDVLEHLDFALSDPKAAREMLAAKTAACGFASHWVEPVWRMIHDLVAIPLDNGSAVLRDVAMDQRSSEMEFYFPIKGMTPERLAVPFDNDHPDPAMHEKVRALEFGELAGFMHGFIDLVFRSHGRYYIVDWKSNFLGDSLRDYAPERLHETMLQELYFLQYHLYAVAVDRYLGARMPQYTYEKNFGGVFYVFLRGISRQTGAACGVYADRPGERLIKSLGRALGGD